MKSKREHFSGVPPLIYYLLNRQFMRPTIVLAGMAALIWASSAHALDPGECGTPEAMTAKLKAEGQRSAMMADQVMPGKKLQAVIFTTNQDGSVGYIMLSDKMSDERSSKFCVQERLTDLRWHDARKNGIPAAAKLRSSAADAERRCAELERTGKIKVIKGDDKKPCAPLNVLLEERDQLGIRPMLQGFIEERGPDGSFRKTGTLATVIGNVSGLVVAHQGRETTGFAGGIIYTSLPDGASLIGQTLLFPKYTEYGLNLLP